MSKNSYAAGVFVARHKWPVALVVVLLAVWVFGPSDDPNPQKPLSAGVSSTAKPITSAVVPKPDPCTTNQATRLDDATKLVKSKKYDAAADMLYACTSNLSDGEKTLYEKALTLANAERDRLVAIEAKAEKARKKKEGVVIGMTMQDAIDSSWGKPEKINRTITTRGTREQWVYDGSYLYFQDGVLTAIQN